MEKANTPTTVPRRTLGRYLRDLREQSGVTVIQAAAHMECSTQKIWRIEGAQTSTKRIDVKNLCELYGVDSELTEALMALASETKATGWWHAYGDVLPEGFDLFIGLEEAASELRWYEAEVVPGLCQAEGYASALIRKGKPGIYPEEVQRRVHVRTARGRILRRPTGAPDAKFVIGEGILHRPIGGPGVMAAQLDHLIEVAELPSTSLRVVPYGAGLHHGVMTGPFLVMRFPPKGRIVEADTIYIESFLGALYLEKKQEVERYEAAFADIWTAAANEKKSVEMIKRAFMELKRQ